MPISKQSILLDTDIGSDIDDALALAYLLRQSECRLAGITTVTGEPHRRAQIAQAICAETGDEDIPIHVGISEPLSGPVRQPHASQADALGGTEPAEFSGASTAVDFLRDSIRANPGELTLLAIGPLTNVAVLFREYPELPGMLRRMVLMGGHFSGPLGGETIGAEWNILNDPEAASVVFATSVDILAVGLEVTTKCAILKLECRARLSEHGMPAVIAPMAEIWLDHAPQATFHDPLAAAVIFQPNLCGYERGNIHVDISSGVTRFAPSQSGPHRIASSVNPDAFFDHYFATIRGESNNG